MRFTFDAVLYRWAARRELWTFVDLPGPASAEIREVVAGRAGGFGSVRVEARIGGSLFRTSIFPGGEDSAYVLPVKRAVREREGLVVDAPVSSIEVEVLGF